MINTTNTSLLHQSIVIPILYTFFFSNRIRILHIIYKKENELLLKNEELWKCKYRVKIHLLTNKERHVLWF